MAVNVAWLVGRELVALHVASNQVEFIFSDPDAAGNDWAVSRGEYSISSAPEASEFVRFTVPAVSPSLINLLDRRVASAAIADGDDLTIAFEAGGAIILHGGAYGSYEVHDYCYGH